MDALRVNHCLADSQIQPAMALPRKAGSLDIHSVILRSISHMNGHQWIGHDLNSQHC